MVYAYQFWLRGTDTLFTYDAASETTTGTESAPSVISTPSSSDWVAVPAMALDPQDDKDGEEFRTPGNEVFSDPFQRRSYVIQVASMKFPTDMATYDAIMTHLRKKYIYIAHKSGYPYTFHTAGKAIAVDCTYATEHDHTGGFKKLTITLKKHKRT